MPEERKLVTVLFADIVGSTEMGLSHDPEVVRAALGQAFESTSRILREHGGTVEKFIGDAARRQLELARAFYRDPLAERHRERIDALLRRAAAPTG